MAITLTVVIKSDVPNSVDLDIRIGLADITRHIWFNPGLVAQR